MTPKVFGIGLNKTGTSTLGECFKALGYKHLSYCRPLLVSVQEDRMEEVFTVIDGYESFEDWPYPMIYRELFQYYSDALFILTVRRSPEVWVDSLKSHSLRTDPETHVRRLIYGHEYPHGFEEEHITFYRTHNAGVVDFFRRTGASDRLLCACWENGDGWPELCEFLRRPVPSMPFPHANKRTSASPFLAENMRRVAVQLAGNRACPEASS